VLLVEQELSVLAEHLRQHAGIGWCESCAWAVCLEQLLSNRSFPLRVRKSTRIIFNDLLNGIGEDNGSNRTGNLLVLALIEEHLAEVDHLGNGIGSENPGASCLCKIVVLGVHPKYG